MDGCVDASNFVARLFFAELHRMQARVVSIVHEQIGMAAALDWSRGVQSRALTH